MAVGPADNRRASGQRSLQVSSCCLWEVEVSTPQRQELPVDPDVGRRPRVAAGPLVAIAVGGACGGVARYAVALAVGASTFPWATFGVNVSGAALLAFLMVLILELWPPTRFARPFAATGFCGAYTTMSTFAVETDHLASHDHPALAVAYVAASAVCGLVAAVLGMTAGRRLAARHTKERA